MTFKMTVTVPRITTADIEEMEKMVPNLSSVIRIPIIATRADVEKAAREIGAKSLNRMEYVSRVEAVEVSPVGGWNVELVISGD